MQTYRLKTDSTHLSFHPDHGSSQQDPWKSDSHPKCPTAITDEVVSKITGDNKCVTHEYKNVLHVNSRCKQGYYTVQWQL